MDSFCDDGSDFGYYVYRVHEKLNVRYAVIAVPMAVLISVGVFVLEWFWSYRKDLESLGVSTLDTQSLTREGFGKWLRSFVHGQ